MKHQRRRLITVFAAIAGTTAFFGRALEMPTQTLDHVPTSVSRVSLNDNGWGVWTTGRQSDSQVFLWDGKKVRPLGLPGRNNRDAVINLNNWVVWSADREDGNGSSDIYLWKGEGDPICLSAKCVTSSEPHLNNRGDIVWWGSEGGENEGIADVFYLPLGMRNPINLTEGDPEGASRNPRINNAGTVSYERSTEQKRRVVINLVFVDAAQPKKRVQVTDSNDLNVTNGGINSAGELVYEQYDDAKKQWHVWKYTPKTRPVCLTSTITGNSHQPMITAAGTVAWHTDMRGKSELFWYDGKNTAAIPVPHTGSFTRPVAVNSHGMILYTSGDGSGTGFDVILASPEKQRGNSAVIWSLLIACSGVAISLLRGSQGRLYTNLSH